MGITRTPTFFNIILKTIFLYNCFYYNTVLISCQIAEESFFTK